MQNGVAAMAWGCAGYRLVLAEAGMAAQVLELSLAKSPRGSHRILHPSSAQPGPGRPPPSEIHILQVWPCNPAASICKRLWRQPINCLTNWQQCIKRLHESPSSSTLMETKRDA